jgi:hypothetical protein
MDDGFVYVQCAALKHLVKSETNQMEKELRAWVYHTYTAFEP